MTKSGVLSARELERVLALSPLTGQEGTLARSLVAVLFCTGAPMEDVLLMNHEDLHIDTREGKEGYVLRLPGHEREVFVPYENPYLFLGDIFLQLTRVAPGTDKPPSGPLFSGKSRPFRVASSEPNKLAHRMNRITAWKVCKRVSSILTPRNLQASCPFRPSSVGT